jgi:hypothetical protein
MKDTDFNKLPQFAVHNGIVVPANEVAIEIVQASGDGEVLTFKEMTERDLSFHRCYMSLLSYIYNYLPSKFREAVSKEKFYLWLKHLKGQYNVVFEFKDGTKMVEYESISFGRMSEMNFRNYVKEQLPYIYENVIGAFYKDEMYKDIIDTIEQDYEKFFSKL